jgi:hypothetical protein
VIELEGLLNAFGEGIRFQGGLNGKMSWYLGKGKVWRGGERASMKVLMWVLLAFGLLMDLTGND